MSSRASCPCSYARFLATESAGAILLVGATVVALVWANSPWSETYQNLWSAIASVQTGEPACRWTSTAG
ncbi:Na+/H+ antiporter NhaA [Georgenia daeguensis]|uniref:DUF998 domain-containing protein n=1 Tax=Georgenia daeguensis TaxID=908355 RepID=A0ABP6ULI9_9MICO